MASLSPFLRLIFGLALVTGALGLGLGLGRGDDERDDDDGPFARRKQRKQQRERAAKRATGLKVLFTSIGGVGTTGLMLQLKQVTPPVSTNNLDDWDGFKHKPYGRLLQSASFKARGFEKAIYVHGNLTRLLVQLDKKGMLLKHAAKTRTNEFPKGESSTAPTNLQAYADDPQEMFEFEKHFDSFYSQSAFPVAFVRASEMLNHVQELADFLEVSRDEVSRVLEPLRDSTSETCARCRKENETQQDFEDRDIVEELGREVALEGDEEFKPAHDASSEHDQIEVSQDIKEKLRKKLLSVQLKYNSIPGFKIVGARA